MRKTKTLENYSKHLKRQKNGSHGKIKTYQNIHISQSMFQDRMETTITETGPMKQLGPIVPMSLVGQNIAK